MALIPADELSELKTTTDLVRLVEQRGVSLSKKGADFVGCCPFHEDSTPSLVVTPSKNLWHCFGCNAGGDVVQWVMKAQGVSFRHAVELLREGATSTATSPTRSTARTLPPPVTLDVDDTALLGQVSDYYHRCLLREPQALSYLIEKRGLSREAIEHCLRRSQMLPGRRPERGPPVSRFVPSRWAGSQWPAAVPEHPHLRRGPERGHVVWPRGYEGLRMPRLRNDSSVTDEKTAMLLRSSEASWTGAGRPG